MRWFLKCNILFINMDIVYFQFGVIIFREINFFKYEGLKDIFVKFIIDFG